MKNIGKILINNDIILGNSKYATFGNAGIEVLKNLKIFDKVKQNIKYQNNIALVVDKVIWSNN